jgi:uncharacterized RDD family membrane protein YckC
METMVPQPSGDAEPSAVLFDKHTIETPEQLRLDFPVAGIGSRFLALAIDTLIQLAAVIIGGIGFGLILSISRPASLRSSQIWIVAAAAFAFFLVFFGYFAIFEILWNGQTPGKRIIGIRVIKDSGRPLTAAESIGRNLLRIVDQMPGFYALGMIVALLNTRNQRLGDLVAGSLVVRESSSGAARPVWHASRTQPAHTHPAAGASALSLDDLTLIDTFLNRRDDLTPLVRSQMAARIVDQLKARVAFQQHPGVTDEALLERLAYERRSSGGA